MTTTLPGERGLLVAVEVPVKQAGQGQAYVKFSHPASRYASHRRRRPDQRDRRQVHVCGRGPRRADSARASCGRRGKGHHWTNAVTQHHCKRGRSGDARSRRRHPRRRVRIGGVSPGRGAGMGQACLDGGHRPREVIPASIDDLQAKLGAEQYIADRRLATSLFVALKLQRPLLLEGEAGVGKTEVAKALRRPLDTDLDPAAVLRRPRHQPRRVRVELREAAARHPPDGGVGRRRSPQSRRRAVQRRSS